jgi:hypothetical protein
MPCSTRAAAARHQRARSAKRADTRWPAVKEEARPSYLESSFFLTRHRHQGRPLVQAVLPGQAMCGLDFRGKETWSSIRFAMERIRILSHAEHSPGCSRLHGVHFSRSTSRFYGSRVDELLTFRVKGQPSEAGCPFTPMMSAILTAEILSTGARSSPYQR